MTTLQVHKKLLTINEAASALGLGRSLIYTLVAKGELKSIKIGRARRIPLGAIDEFIERRLEQELSDAEGRG
ncbi:MAG: helix-turn-helix domain-containing protein [Ktedonobacteraceae bacterium]